MNAQTKNLILLAIFIGSAYSLSMNAMDALCEFPARDESAWRVFVQRDKAGLLAKATRVIEAQMQEVTVFKDLNNDEMTVDGYWQYDGADCDWPMVQHPLKPDAETITLLKKQIAQFQS